MMPKNNYRLQHKRKPKKERIGKVSLQGIHAYLPT